MNKLLFVKLVDNKFADGTKNTQILAITMGNKLLENWILERKGNCKLPYINSVLK